jgi:predicted alpha-1,6-mannanase (GH76 family)
MRLGRVLLSVVAVSWATPALTSGITAVDGAKAFTAYCDAFYFTNGTNGYFRESTTGGKTWFWERAEQMEMLLDVYERTSNNVCLTMFSNVFNGFLTDHGSNWSRNDFNDDIMWMVIACARGYQHTGNPAFRDAAKANFDLCFERAWSTNLGGGLWWKTDNRSKNACVNGPGAIAAHLLYQICGDTNYLAKAERLYQWERTTLFDAKTGAVSDSIDREGQLATFNLTYNQGTFIGAANLLGHTNDARLAADFMVNHLSRDGLMPRYRPRGDAGGFNGIGARWLARWRTQRGWEPRYQAWLRANAEAAWEARRISDNLIWPRWPRPTPAGELQSWACSSAVVVMHVAPPSAGAGNPSSGETNEFLWSGVATNARGDVLATITVNTAEAPDLTNWGRRAGELCVLWYPKLAELLASDGFIPASRVQLNFRSDYNGVAATSRAKIDISAGYVRRATNDFGMVIHELTHVVQDYRRGGNPGWLVEGVADYIRLTHFEPQARRPRIDPERASYRDAYKTTAIFLEWVEKHHDPQLVKELNRAMREGNYRPELFQERTAKTLDELWTGFVQSLPR